MFDWAINFIYWLNDFFYNIIEWIYNKLSDIELNVLVLTIFFTISGYFFMFIVPKLLKIREYGSFEKIIIAITLPFISYFIIKKMIG